MDLKISFVIFTVLFFMTIFSIFTGEASIFISPKASPATSPWSSSSSGMSSSSSLTTCDMDYISGHINVISELNKEFLKKYIKSRNKKKYIQPQNEKRDKIDEKTRNVCTRTTFLTAEHLESSSSPSNILD